MQRKDMMKKLLVSISYEKFARRRTGTVLSSNGADGVAIACKSLYYRDIFGPLNSFPTRFTTSDVICAADLNRLENQGGDSFIAEKRIPRHSWQLRLINNDYRFVSPLTHADLDGNGVSALVLQTRSRDSDVSTRTAYVISTAAPRSLPPILGTRQSTRLR